MSKINEKITKQFIAFVTENGHFPASVHQFCKFAKVQEDQFWKEFGSLDAVYNAILTNLFNSTTQSLQSTEEYLHYGFQEKLLALHFTFFEQAMALRSFFKACNFDVKQVKNYLFVAKNIHKHFGDFVSGIVAEAESAGEIPSRKIIDKTYKEALWLNFIFIFGFWYNDNSANCEKTDACIEKSVNLATDLIKRNTLDQIIDFGKFLVQNR